MISDMDILKTIFDELYRLVVVWHSDYSSDFPGNSSNTFLSTANLLCRHNFNLWHEEDKARDPHASDSLIATVKRNIDKLNQMRNDTIEVLDDKIIATLDSNQPENLPMNSETPGSIVDKLSINALKIYHMHEQTERADATADHIEKCTQKLAILRAQAGDLQNCLSSLIDDLMHGKKRMKLYRQMKMYNDPTLNPVLYSQKK